MVRWHPFDPGRYSFEFNIEELAAHGVTPQEAAEVFWNGIEVRRNKVHRDRYQVDGRTDSGRALKLIVQAKSSRVLRVITGWSI